MKIKRVLFLTVLFLLVLVFQVQALTTVQLSPSYFPEANRGRPIANGKIYVGMPDTDPEVVINQKTLSVLQEDGSIIEVSQPIYTSAGGIPVYSGSPVTLLVDGNYSLKVLNSYDVQAYYIPSVDLNQSGNFYPDYNATDQGVTGDSNTVKYYVDTISTDSGTIVFQHNSGAATTTYTFSTSETIPSNINVVIEKGAILSIAAAQTLTINGPFDAGLYQVFSGAGSIVFGATSVSIAYPKWWGLSPDATAAVNSAALQASIDSTAPIIKIGSGTFSYDTGLVIDRAIRFDGAISMERWSSVSVAETVFLYTGNGVGITLTSNATHNVNLCYNIHLSNFSLHGNVNALGGILCGTSDTLGIILSSLTNIHVNIFDKANAYGIKLRRVQQTVFKNVYGHQCHYGFMSDTDGLNTTMTFTNCHARSNTIGWYLNGSVIGSSWYQCLSESNKNAGLYIYGKGVTSLSFYQWHSESNNIVDGTAPNIIKGALGNAPIYINFFGGYFGDDVGGLIWDLDYAERISWNYITMPNYTSSIQTTAYTTNCSFNIWSTSMAFLGAGQIVINNNTDATLANIADDVALSFIPNRPSGLIHIYLPEYSMAGIFVYSTSATYVKTLIVTAHANFEITTGVLAGTTGTDGKFTLSVHTDGKMYMENRLGTPIKIRYSLDMTGKKIA